MENGCLTNHFHPLKTGWLWGSKYRWKWRVVCFVSGIFWEVTAKGEGDCQRGEKLPAFCGCCFLLEVGAVCVSKKHVSKPVKKLKSHLLQTWVLHFVFFFLGFTMSFQFGNHLVEFSWGKERNWPPKDSGGTPPTPSREQWEKITCLLLKYIGDEKLYPFLYRVYSRNLELNNQSFFWMFGENRMGVSKNSGTPKWMVYNGNHY